MPLHATVFFDEHVLRPVDHDVRDAWLFQQDLQRPEAKRFVKDFFDQSLSFRTVQQRVFRVAQMFDHESNLAAQRVPLQIAQASQVELLDQLAVNRAAQFFKVLRGGIHSSSDAR